MGHGSTTSPTISYLHKQKESNAKLKIEREHDNNIVYSFPLAIPSTNITVDVTVNSATGTVLLDVPSVPRISIPKAWIF